MTEVLSHVNWLVVGVASVAQFVLGAVWFVELVGKHYPVVLGIADRPQEKPGPLSLIGLEEPCFKADSQWETRRATENLSLRVPGHAR